ncbi:MAG TPA: hypothetical protein PKM25_10925, partial [Candidatus Ozemobacteraceae bacterium]|nr:hypothetical protein [Candidatus Ozemobacteraceae bacterium]
DDTFLYKRKIVPHNGIPTLVGPRIEGKQVLCHFPEFRQTRNINTSPYRFMYRHPNIDLLDTPSKRSGAKRRGHESPGEFTADEG